MRVVQLVDSLGSGGAQRLAMEIAREGAARWTWSGLIAVAGAGSVPGLDRSDVPCFNLGSGALEAVTPVGQATAFLAAYAQLRGLVSYLSVDVVQTHLPLANFLGLMLGLQGGRRVFGTVHNTREFSYGNATHPLRAWARRFGYRQILHRCSGLIAVSAGVRDAVGAEMGLDARERGRIEVVTNGVRPAGMISSEKRQALRQARGVSEDEVFIITVGRLTDQKNTKDLVDALARLGQGVGRWSCCIAGDGPNHVSLERRIGDLGLGDRVRLAGFEPDVAALMGTADILVLPSLWEGLPLTGLEAMAAGLPVVGYRIPGLVEVVDDGVHGHLVATGDVGALATTLAGLVADGDRRRRLGEAGRDRVQQEYSFTRVLDDLEKVYAGRDRQ